MLSGYASTVTDASMPGFSMPMSVSSTSVRTCMSPRSAITKSVVPPDTFCEADWMTTPSSTFFWMIVPSIGATIRTSLSWSWARLKFVFARTSAACAFV